MNKDIIIPKIDEDEIEALKNINLAKYVSEGIHSLKNYFKRGYKKHSFVNTILATIRYMNELEDEYPKLFLFYPSLFRMMYSRVFLGDSAGYPILELEDEALRMLKSKTYELNKLLKMDDPYEGFEIVAIYIVNCIFAEGLWII
jgi:hypothetical protein